MKFKAIIEKISLSSNSNSYDISFKSDKSISKSIFKVPIYNAKNIALANEGIQSNRLNTYRLFLDLLSLLKIKITKVEISNIHKSIYSSILLQHNNKNIKLSSDYTDGIILSMLSLCPLYLDEFFFKNSYIHNENINNENEILENNNLLKLETILKNLIKKEEYESAAKIRDKINKLIN